MGTWLRPDASQNFTLNSEVFEPDGCCTGLDFFTDFVLVGKFPEGTFFVVGIFEIAPTYAEFSVNQVHCDTGSVHLCRNVVRNPLEFFDEAGFRLHADFVGFGNAVRHGADCGSAAGCDFGRTPLVHAKNFSDIVADL